MGARPGLTVGVLVPSLPPQREQSEPHHAEVKTSATHYKSISGSLSGIESVSVDPEIASAATWSRSSNEYKPHPNRYYNLNKTASVYFPEQIWEKDLIQYVQV